MARCTPLKKWVRIAQSWFDFYLRLMIAECNCILFSAFLFIHFCIGFIKVMAQVLNEYSRLIQRAFNTQYQEFITADSGCDIDQAHDILDCIGGPDSQLITYRMLLIIVDEFQCNQRDYLMFRSGYSYATQSFPMHWVLCAYPADADSDARPAIGSRRQA